MVLVRVVAFLAVLVAVLVAAVAVQKQQLLVPDTSWIMHIADRGGAPRDAPGVCNYIGVEGMESTPRTGADCPMLRDPDWAAELRVSQAEARSAR